MQNRRSRRRQSALFLPATLMLAGGFTPLRAQVSAPLSVTAQARADGQIAAVMTDKATRTPAQNKMDFPPHLRGA